MAPDSWPHGIGFGWAIGTGGTPSAVHHAGDQKGVTTMLYMVPDQRRAVVLMTNLQGRGGVITTLADELAEILSTSVPKNNLQP